MRIGSSTYMNDPSEGKGLLELLNIPEWKLENKTDCSTSNAFFTCFSSRVNDLNNFAYTVKKMVSKHLDAAWFLIKKETG